jgi:drug/metabolite transporter (DMT)-like permease
LLRAYVDSDASFIAPLLFVQLVWSTTAGWAFFDQLPDALSCAGIALILVSGIATMLWVRAHRSVRT